MANPNLSADYCTTGEAAELLGVSLRTIQTMVENGRLAAWKTDGGHRRIPRAAVAALRADGNGLTPPSRQRELDPGRLKVLVVEDDPVLMRLYKTVIGAWGLPVDLVTAANGVEGLIRIGKDSPDLLISDLAMPGMDGCQMIRHLANSAFREGMEIVVVSGLEPDEVAARGGLPADVRMYPKPVPFPELRRIVESLFARRREIIMAASRPTVRPGDGA